MALTKISRSLLDTGVSDSSDATAITIDSSENVGIGTSSPNAYSNVTTLTINGTNQGRVDLEYGGTLSGSFLALSGQTQIKASGGSQVMVFEVNDAERMRIDTSGLIGIGTTSPSSYYSGADNLVVHQSSGEAGITVATATNTTGALYFADGTSGNEAYRGGIAYSHGAEILSLVSGGATKAIINSSGQLGVNTSTFDVYAQHVIQADYNQKVLDLKQNNASGRVLGLQYIPNGPDDSTDYYMVCSDANTNDMFIYSNGNLANKNNSYGSSSDIKIKQNISDANSQWNDIKALQFKNYKLKNDVARYGEDNANTLLGLIAQDLETAGMNGLVYESKDEDSEGNKLDTVTKGIKYSVLYLKAVKALQEAMIKIEDLESRIETLEG